MFRSFCLSVCLLITYSLFVAEVAQIRLWDLGGDFCLSNARSWGLPIRFLSFKGDLLEGQIPTIIDGCWVLLFEISAEVFRC